MVWHVVKTATRRRNQNCVLRCARSRSLQLEQLEARTLLSGTSITPATFDPSAVDISGHELLLPKLGRELTALFVARDRITHELTTERVLPGEWKSPLQFTDNLVSIYAIASEDTNALETDIELLGFRRLAHMDKIVAFSAPLDALDDVASLASVAYARPAYAAIHDAGITNSQGDESMRADEVRSRFNLNGAGITIGVISDSFDVAPGLQPEERAEQDFLTGDLPPLGTTEQCAAGVDAPVLCILEEHNPLDGFTIDEGRAMLQLIHDVVPEAKLLFHRSFNEAVFIDANNDFTQAGADIIVDDLTFLAAPFFQESFTAGIAESSP